MIPVLNDAKASHDREITLPRGHKELAASTDAVWSWGAVVNGVHAAG